MRLDPARFVAALLTDPGAVDDPLLFMRQLYVVAGMAQDAAHLGLSCYDLFTDEELYALWESENALRYLQMGPSATYGAEIAASARPLLRNIVETAQRVIDGREQVAASLDRMDNGASLPEKPVVEGKSAHRKGRVPVEIPQAA